MKLDRWFPGNQVQLLQGGEEYFAQLTQALESARSEIFFEIYIFHDDSVGRQIKDALIRAAQRGVRVSMVFDGVGSISLPKNFYQEFREVGVEVFIFRPVRFFPRFRNLISERMHRKVVVVDEKIAFVGGMNITEEQLSTHPSRSRMDHAVKVEGPLVSEIRLVLLQFRIRLRRRWRLWREQTKEGVLSTGREVVEPIKAAFLIRDNFRHRRRMEKHFLRGIGLSQKNVDIAMAYFLPSGRLLRSFKEASRRGVRVRLLLDGRAEFFWLKWASSFLYPRLLQAGIEIYEYQPKMLHSKLAIFDRRWVSIGSCNLEPISLTLNLEANVLVDDEGFAKKTLLKFEDLLRDAKQVRRERVAQTPWWKRAVHGISYGVLRFLSRILLGAV